MPQRWRRRSATKPCEKGSLFDADRDDRDEQTFAERSAETNRGPGRGGAVVDEDPEAVGAGLGGGFEEGDEAWVDSGGFGHGSVGGTVHRDGEGFSSGTAPWVQNKAVGRMATGSGMSTTSHQVTG